MSRTVIFGPKPFAAMDRADRIRAYYQHCVLRYVMNERMTNQSLSERFHLPEGRATGIPKIIRAMRENGSPAPVFETQEERTTFLVRLPVHPQAKRVAQGTKSAPSGSAPRLPGRPCSCRPDEGRRPHRPHQVQAPGHPAFAGTGAAGDDRAGQAPKPRAAVPDHGGRHGSIEHVGHEREHLLKP